MWRNLFNRNPQDESALFNGHYVDPKAMYVWKFARIPCVAFVGELDVSKAFNHIDMILKNDIVAIYQHAFLNHEHGKLFFNNTVFVLKEKRMIELAENYCHVLHTIYQYEWAHQLITELGSAFRLAPVEEKSRVIGFVRNTDMN